MNPIRTISRSRPANREPAAPGADSAGQHRPAPATTMSRLQAVTAPGLLPRTVQLCIHCRQTPPGFWVSRRGGQTVRRPWCVSSCQELDQDRCDVIPFDG
jgi:hypothetical protein